MAKFLCKFKLEMWWSSLNGLDCLVVLHADQVFELYCYLSFMWLSNKQLFFSSRYWLYPAKSYINLLTFLGAQFIAWVRSCLDLMILRVFSNRNDSYKPLFHETVQKSKNKIRIFCILYRILEQDSKSMKFSILEVDNVQWQLRRGIMTR